MPDSTYQLKKLARNLRKNQTDAEQLLWAHLRNRQLANCKFRRQKQIGKYIADFVCLAKKIIVELDGSQHQDTHKEDKERTRFLEKNGYRVLRFWNNEILTETEAVLQNIYEMLVEKEE